MTAIAPRLIHNETEARKWLARHKISSSIEPVSKQVKTIPLNRRSIFFWGYNPSIVRHNGKLLMAYRYHKENTKNTTLAMAELDDKFNIVANQTIEIKSRKQSMEDPGLFRFNNELWMAYIESNWPTASTCTMHYGELLEGKQWRIGYSWKIKYGHNDDTGLEKNWVFFERNGRLYVIYHSEPIQTVLEVIDDSVVDEHESPGPSWAWGPIRGGTSPMTYNGKLIRFFHSSLDNEPPPWRRRYYFGACLMEQEPPFKTVAVSSEPIIRGSEEDDLTQIERSGCHHRKPQVVFPGGCIPHEDGWLVALGLNDCQSAIAHVKESQLKL